MSFSVKISHATFICLELFIFMATDVTRTIIIVRRYVKNYLRLCVFGQTFCYTRFVLLLCC